LNVASVQEISVVSPIGASPALLILALGYSNGDTCEKLGLPGILVQHGNLPPCQTYGRPLPNIDSVVRIPRTSSRACALTFQRSPRRQGFVLIYIDAFAGSGKRTEELPALPLLGGDNAEPQFREPKQTHRDACYFVRFRGKADIAE
jgi:hypothetical protein